MRKNSGLALLLTLLVVVAATQLAQSQTRARRIETTTANATPSPTPAQDGQEIGEGEVLRINTTLVTVPVSVTDRNGRYIADLEKEDFRLYEDGVEQQVAYFATVEKPFTVVLMLDTSASTWSKLSQIKEAALAFVDQLRPEDQVMVVTFARGFTLKCQPTNDRQKIRAAIQSTGRGMSTHLYDAMERLMRKELAGIQGRKAVVLFTDGVDASSNDATYESTVQLAEELDALIYPIRYDTYDPASDTGSTSLPAPQTNSRLPSILRKIPLPLPGPTITIGGGSGGSNGSSRADYERGERYLHDLAELTGGRVYEASRDLRYLQDAFSRIAEELRRQYSLGYYPDQSGQSGERRRIKVSVNRADVAVRARVSYIYKGPAATPETPPSTTKDKERSAPVLQKKPFVSYGY
ncbi:MAG: VWA domain-containing protein [Pyrinomonadaceae bacterium]|nr:VWA domain-containing protein [Pyrinomonadaceae bacterium]